MCWWCCMRVLEKCLPRNDIVRELAPYLQHVHRDEGANCAEDDNGRRAAAGSSPRGFEFAAYDDKNSATSSDSFRNTPNQGGNLQPMRANSSNDDDCGSNKQPLTVKVVTGPEVRVNPADTPLIDSGIHHPNSKQQQTQRSQRKVQLIAHQSSSSSSTASSSNLLYSSYSNMDSTDSLRSNTTFQSNTSTSCATTSSTVPPAVCVQKLTSMPKIKTDLGDLIPVKWEKVVIVQVSVQGFREMMTQAKDLMEDAKLLYEHTVLSRLTSEYGGQEILSHSRSGLFVIAFASEFHAAKWCLSLQLSLVYAAWNEKLLKQFDDMKECYIRGGNGKSKRNHLLYRGFRVRMVIHTADPELTTEKSLSEAVKWTKTVSEYAHGGQIILSDSVWDRLKEQLVQLGNPVVEDLGCHAVLGDEVVLMLLLPRDLECRRFNPLNSPMQLSLGMRDAPSAQRPVTMVFTFIEGARPLVRCHAEELAERIKTLCTVARELLRKHNGYECQELQGDFMLAFFQPCNAILWCGEFQLRIREKFREWNRESENRELMFSMSMGIETGVPASVSPHKTSGRADYFGNIVNQTARIAKASSGGQILIGSDAWTAFTSNSFRITSVPKTDRIEDIPDSTLFQFKLHGYYSFKGISSPIGLVEALPVLFVGGQMATYRGHNKQPRAKKLEDAQALKEAKTVVKNVPTDYLRLTHSGEKSNDSIRETEWGGNVGFSWNDSLVMVEEADFDEEGDSPSVHSMMTGSAALAMSYNQRNHPGMLHVLRNSLSSIASNSPRAAASEQMDRV